MLCLAISSIPIGIIGGIEGFQASIVLIGLIFLVTFFVSLAISYLITRPIEKLTENIDKISKGKLDVNIEGSEISEINNLTNSLNRVMISLKLAINKVGVKKAEIFEEAVKAKESVEQKNQDILNSIVGWAWETDSKGNYTFCSENINKLLGYSADEIIGKSAFDFIIPEDVKKAKSVFYDVSKTKKGIHNLENWMIKKNGEKLCMLTNAKPFFDDDGNLIGYRGVDTDITNQKIMEKNIKNLNKEISEIKAEMTGLLNKRDKVVSKIDIENNFSDEKWTEHEFDSVFILDENANILDCNENMYKRLGYTKSEILSLNMADFDALESKNDIKEKINEAKRNGVCSFKSIHKRKDGSAVLVYENMQYVKNKKSFKCIVREDYSMKQK